MFDLVCTSLCALVYLLWSAANAVVLNKKRCGERLLER